MEWQQKIAGFHNRIALADLMKAIDFDCSMASCTYPDLGVITTDPKLPKMEGLERYAFAGRIFGMQAR